MNPPSHTLSTAFSRSTFRIAAVLHAFLPVHIRDRVCRGGSVTVLTSFKPFLFFFDDTFFLEEGTQSSLARFLNNFPMWHVIDMGRKVDEISSESFSAFFDKIIFEVPHGQIDLVQHILDKPRNANLGFDTHFRNILGWMRSLSNELLLTVFKAFSSSICVNSSCHISNVPFLQWDIDFRLLILLYFSTIIFVKSVVFLSVRLQKKSVPNVRQQATVRRAISSGVFDRAHLACFRFEKPIVYWPCFPFRQLEFYLN